MHECVSLSLPSSGVISFGLPSGASVNPQAISVLLGLPFLLQGGLLRQSQTQPFLICSQQFLIQFLISVTSVLNAWPLPLWEENNRRLRYRLLQLLVGHFSFFSFSLVEIQEISWWIPCESPPNAVRPSYLLRVRKQIRLKLMSGFYPKILNPAYRKFAGGGEIFLYVPIWHTYTHTHK